MSNTYCNLQFVVLHVENPKVCQVIRCGFPFENKCSECELESCCCCCDDEDDGGLTDDPLPGKGECPGPDECMACKPNSSP